MFKKEKIRVKLTSYFLETFVLVIFVIMIILYLTIVDNLSSVKQNLETFRALIVEPLVLEVDTVLGSISNLSLTNLIISIVAITLLLIITIYLLRIFIVLKEEALVDHLTGLYNRRFFMNILYKEILRAKRFKHHLSIILLDIDHFKIYNDKYGHKMGDKVLKTIAQILKRSVRKIDTVFRYGGEEFVVLVPETNFEKVSLLAERIRRNVEIGSKRIKNIRHHVTVSLGVATYKKEYRSSKMIENADKLLYEAKNAGRNIVKRAYFGA